MGADLGSHILASPLNVSPRWEPSRLVTSVRGRLIFQFLAELRQLDADAMSTQAPGYDEDFKEPALLDTDGDGAGEPYRREHPPVRVPCQVEPQTIEALRMTPAGNTPQSSLDLVFHFSDLERLAAR